MAKKFKQGKFNPKFPEKYKGDHTQIFYRSSWEFKVMVRLDSNPDVIQWSSEEVVIGYICKTDNKPHRYFTDFWVKMKKNDIISEYIIEIKPFAQTQPPKKPDKITKRYINEMMTYAKNISKWEAAQAYAKKHNMTFQTLTEKELGF